MYGGCGFQMIRQKNWCGTMRVRDPKKYHFTYALFVDGNRVPIVWKRLNHLNRGSNR